MDLELPLQLPLDHLPLRLRFEHPLTDDELQTFCERQEVLHVEREPDGSLSVRSIGGTLAGMVSCDVLVQLGNWAEGNGRGQVIGTVGFWLPDGSMRGPRIAFLPTEQWDALTPEAREGFLPLCPAFVLEVLSINYTLAELQKRMRMWLANGAQLAWLIDPSRKAVEIYRPNQQPEMQEGHSAVYGEGPVGGFVLELGRVWG